MRYLYVVRHGQTDYNKRRLYAGRHPVPLNSTGLKQAYHTAKYLKPKNIDKIYSSPVLRTMQTAKIIGKSHNLLPIPMDLLTERGIDERFFGKNVPANIKGVLNPEGQEKWTDLSKRMMKAYHRMLRIEGDIVMVSHGDPIAYFIYTLFFKGANPSKFCTLAYPATASLTIIENVDGKPHLRLYNYSMPPETKS